MSIEQRFFAGELPLVVAEGVALGMGGAVEASRGGREFSGQLAISCAAWSEWGVLEFQSPETVRESAGRGGFGGSRGSGAGESRAVVLL